MTDLAAKPLVWIIDSLRGPLAESAAAVGACCGYRYFTSDDSLPDAADAPDAVLFSGEIEGGPGGEAFAYLRQRLAGTPLLACARVRSLAQAVAYFRNGAADYLPLPLDPGEIADRLAAAFAREVPPAVMVELEALDGDGPDAVSLAVGGDDDDILAQLSGEEQAAAGIDDGNADSESEPVAVDGLPIPSLWEELPCGLLAFDSEGNLVFSNRLAMDMFGFETLGDLQDALDNRRSSFAARGVNRKALPDNQWPHSAAIRARTARHGLVSFERPDGSRVWLRMDCLPHLSGGSLARLTVTLVNMTGEIPSIGLPKK